MLKQTQGYKRWLSIGTAAIISLVSCSKEQTTDQSTTSQPQVQGQPSKVGKFLQTAPELQYPIRIVESDGIVYVSDAVANAVVMYRDKVAVGSLVGLEQPIGLAVSGDLLYVGNVGRHDVEVYSLSKRQYIYSLGGGESFELPNSIAVAPDGEVYVVDSKRDVVKIFSESGEYEKQFGTSGRGEGEFSFPVAVAVDEQQVVVGDQGNHRVQVFDRGGKFERSFGSEVEQASSSLQQYRGKFTSIGAVAIDEEYIYALDSVHAYVQMFSKQGEHEGIFGYTGQCGSCTKMPLDIAVVEGGRVLATDPDNHRWVSLSTEMR